MSLESQTIGIKNSLLALLDENSDLKGYETYDEYKKNILKAVKDIENALREIKKWK